MKNNTKIFLMIAALFLTGATTANVSAQTKTGGYKKIAANDAGAMAAAANFAAQNQGEKDNAEIAVQSVETAERQTAAGANYKLCIEVFRLDEGEDVEIRQFVQTTVFQNLKKQYTLKSWEEVEDCGAPE